MTLEPRSTTIPTKATTMPAYAPESMNKGQKWCKFKVYGASDHCTRCQALDVAGRAAFSGLDCGALSHRYVQVVLALLLAVLLLSLAFLPVFRA